MSPSESDTDNSSKAEINKSIYEVYSDMETNLHQTQEKLNTKAIEVIKVNLLVGGLVASVISITESVVSLPYFIGECVSLLVSIGFCINVYSQTKPYKIGEDTENLEEMLEQTDLVEHYENLAKDFSNNIDEFKQVYKEEKSDFEIGLWTAYGTVFLFVLGAVRTILAGSTGINYSYNFDIVLVVFLLLIAAARFILLFVDNVSNNE